MKTEHICPSCQKSLPEGAPQGLCPECLMKAGFGSAAGQPGGNPRFVPPSVADLARLFPQLEILQLIGQGGMGAVYRARQPGLDRVVALKILPPESTAASGFTERFTREARALAKLNHPNIVSVYDFGQAGGLHYFLMEYVDGLNLRQLVQGSRLSAREALEIVPQMCEALQFAHDEGVVHRDIKPENVLVDKRGRVKIADFGLAKLLGSEPENLQLTGAKDVMGTPHYMAPEQMEKPTTVDHRADIYSLGVVFYELLTGELPIGKFSPPSKKVAVDVRLDEVVLHTLEKEPDRRYQHASQVKTDVEEISHTPSPIPLAPKSLEAAELEEACRQVKGPGTGLLVTAILNWVGIPLIVLVSAYLASRQGRPTNLLLVALPLAALVLSSVMLVAGLKMKRLQAYWLAVTGSILAIFITPGNLIGLPIGIWSLVVLSQARVRSCFGKEPPLATLQAAAAPQGSGGWKIAAVIVAALMLICAIPIGLFVVGITLPALHKAKARSANLAEFGPVKEVTLHAVTPNGNRNEALDLDSGRVLQIPDEHRQEGDALRWITEQGLDVVLLRESGRWGLGTTAGNELKLTPVTNERWTYKLPQSPPRSGVVSETIRDHQRVTFHLTADVEPPLTFSFHTASGAQGLFQISAFDESQNCANLRVKALKNK